MWLLSPAFIAELGFEQEQPQLEPSSSVSAQGKWG